MIVFANNIITFNYDFFKSFEKITEITKCHIF